MSVDFSQLVGNCGSTAPCDVNTTLLWLDDVTAFIIFIHGTLSKTLYSLFSDMGLTRIHAIEPVQCPNLNFLPQLTLDDKLLNQKQQSENGTRPISAMATMPSTSNSVRRFVVAAAENVCHWRRWDR